MYILFVAVRITQLDYNVHCTQVIRSEVTLDQPTEQQSRPSRAAATEARKQCREQLTRETRQLNVDKRQTQLQNVGVMIMSGR